MDNRASIEEYYGHKLRLRVCGICLDKDGRILMVKHTGLGKEGELWLPPGGGMEWGQSAPENLKREFLEETGLEVKVGSFMFVHEHMQDPIHAVELFFRVYPIGGFLTTGTDPELAPQQQIIQEVRYFYFEELMALGNSRLHAIFGHYSSTEALNNAGGYFKFGK